MQSQHVVQYMLILTAQSGQQLYAASAAVSPMYAAKRLVQITCASRFARRHPAWQVKFAVQLSQVVAYPSMLEIYVQARVRSCVSRL